MAMYNESLFKEGLVSELSLFDLPSTQTGVLDEYFEEIRPLSQVSAESPVEFKISGQNSMDYLDMKNSQIYVKLKVKKSDGTNLSAEKVGPANLILHTLFSTVEVSLQNKASFTCNYYPYRAYIQTLLKYGQDASSSQLNTQGWEIDDADAPGVTDPGSTNTGLYNRAKWIAGSKTIDFQGSIFHDMFSLDRYLLNQVDVRVKFYRTPPSFSLLAADTTVDFDIEILDIYLLARKIRVNPGVIYGHSQVLEKNNALYPYTKVECRSQSIATGSTSFNWENMFQGRRPERIVIGFVKSTALNGSYTTNPFNFENLSIEQIAVYVDGLPAGGNPLQLDFSNPYGAISRAYNNIFLSEGIWTRNEGNALNREHFVGGSSLFVFQLEPNYAHHGQYMSLVKNANVRLEVRFKNGLTGI